MRTVIIIASVTALLLGGFFFLAGRVFTDAPVDVSQAVRVEDGTQIITITAKGGYSPRKVTAQAGLPSVLKVTTKGTFDCSSALVIPDLNYRTNLPPSGVTEISIPVQKAGAKLTGLCSMGMYSFDVVFQ